MINSISLDNQSISASIISAQQNLNDKLNSIEVLLQSFNSDLNNINDTVLYFVDELKAISNQVITLVDDTIEIVECNQSYDSSWKIKLPPNMVETITDTLIDIKDNLENIEIEDIGNICTNIYGSCTVGHNTISPTEPTQTDTVTCTSKYDPNMWQWCHGGHCAASYMGPNGKCNSDYCARSYGDLLNGGLACSGNHCVDYEAGGTTTIICPSKYSDSITSCNGLFYTGETLTGETNCKSYYTKKGGESFEVCQVNFRENSTGVKECASVYANEDKDLCVSSYTENKEGEKNCTDYSTKGGESCGMYSSNNSGTTSCINDYAKGDATCEALYGYTEGGGESCLTTFSTDIGSCTGYKTDGGSNDRTCASNYDIGGGVTCPSGYGVEGNNVICASNVESGSCTSNVGQESCTFNAGCTQCYGSNHHQDCPQMGCWDVTIPE